MGARGLDVARLLIDTNVIVRLLVNDHPAHFEQARKLFALAERGDKSVLVLPMIVAETIFILQSVYKQPRQSIASSLEVFLSQRWIGVEERSVLLSALRDFGQGQAFVDACLLAWTKEHEADLFTFDKKLLKSSR
jgi:predicted nucleic acid-binding protein